MVISDHNIVYTFSVCMYYTNCDCHLMLCSWGRRGGKKQINKTKNKTCPILSIKKGKKGKKMVLSDSLLCVFYELKQKESSSLYSTTTISTSFISNFLRRILLLFASDKFHKIISLKTKNECTSDIRIIFAF